MAEPSVDLPKPSEVSLEELVSRHINDGKQGRLDLRDRRFAGAQRLRDLTVEFDVDLERATFPEGLDVQFCTFTRDLNLSDAEFVGHRADFEDCVFRGRPVFRLQAASWLSLRSCTFHSGFDVALPRDAPISLDLRFAVVSGTAVVRPLDYGQAGYSGDVEVGSVEASEMTVSKESSLELAGFNAEKLHLGESTLQDKASVYLSDVQAKALYFNDVRQVDKANVGFNRVDLSTSRFSGSNVERYAFSNVTWPRSDGRVQLLEESEWRKGQRYERAVAAEELNDAAERVIENYRQLVLNFEAKRNYELAEQFHTSEMEMLRHRAGAKLPEWLGRFRFHLNAYGLYRALSGYGADYPRAGGVLLGLLLFFSAAFLLTGISLRGGNSFEYDLLAGADHPSVPLGILATDATRALALTLSIVTIQKDRPMDPIGTEGALLSSVLLLLVPAQAALLLFALRRRFRRASI